MTVVTAVGAADDEPEQPPTNRTAANDRTQRWEQMIGSIEASIDTYRAAEARFEHSWESSDAGDWFPRQVWFQRHLIRRIQSVVADFVGWERLGDRTWDPARSRQQSDRRQPPASPGS
ncbi:MAG: hypothetical protein RLZZ01_978, partial [Actinomycetota bacterium]